MKKLNRDSKNDNLCKKVSTTLLNIIKLLAMPYELLHLVLRSLDSNEWRFNESDLNKKWITKKGSKLQLSLVKSIKNKHGVSFSSVVLAAIGGGIRKFMKEQETKIPRRFHAALVLPMLGHPEEKLRNFM